MKKLCTCIAGLSFLLATNFAHAWSATGFVFCDANQNQTIDGGDSPIANVLVVVTNTSGTFSNAALTAADGSFLVLLPEDTVDTYVETLVAATLPASSTIVLPTPPVFVFSLPNGNSTVFVGNWLINSPECQSGGGGGSGCWLTGGGTIGTGRTPEHSFGGNVFPGCSPTAGQGGQWTDVAHDLKLKFQGTVVTTVNCGNVAGIPAGSTSPVTPFNFIEFSGTGTLKGIGGNDAASIPVLFFARAEDRGEPGKNLDRYYLRVYTADGTTLLLISGDPANPTNVVPVIINTGNLQMHFRPCS